MENILQYIVTLLLILLPTVIRVLVDLRRIEVKKLSIGRWGYKWRWLLTAAATVILSFIASRIVPESFIQHLGLSTGLFILLFDELLNKFRGKPFGYLGTEDEDLSWIEEYIYKKITPREATVGRVLLFLTSLLYYVI